MMDGLVLADQVYPVMLILIMAGAGVLGGYVNHVLSGRSGTARDSIWLGLLASFLVPLFLRTIASDMLATAAKDPLQLFPFAGFCLVAAVVSRRFITGVSERFLRDLEKVEKKASHAEAEAEEAKKGTQRSEAIATAAYAVSKIAKNELSDALEAAFKAIELDPHLAGGHIQKGRTLKRMGDHMGALTAVKEGLRYCPDHPKLLYNSACYKALVGDEEGALTDLGRAAILSPELGALAETDEDLVSLRNNPRLMSIVEAGRKSHEAPV